jgi:hypothetical protein
MSTATRTVSQHLLEPVHPRPEEAHKMPYAPAVRIVGACNLMFISGATPSPLYHIGRRSTIIRAILRCRPAGRWRQSR